MISQSNMRGHLEWADIKFHQYGISTSDLLIFSMGPNQTNIMIILIENRVNFFYFLIRYINKIKARFDHIPLKIKYIMALILSIHFMINEIFKNYSISIFRK